MQHFNHSCSPATSVENVLKDLLRSFKPWNPDPAGPTWRGPRGRLVSSPTHGAGPGPSPAVARVPSRRPRARPHLARPAALLPEVKGDAVRLLPGAEQVDVERDEELPRPRDSGPPAGDEGAGAEVGRPLSLLELWGDQWVREGGGGPTLRGPPPDRPLGGDTAPSQAGPRIRRPGWAAESGGWPSVLPRRTGTLQGAWPVRPSAGGRCRTPIPAAPSCWQRPHL